VPVCADYCILFAWPGAVLYVMPGYAATAVGVPAEGAHTFL
jgi:hypothetical protein